jgi:hypothetical protein
VSDLLHTRSEQALEAARSKLADLALQEEAAIEAGDAEAAVQRRSERLLLEEASLLLVERRAAAEQRREKAGGPPKGLGMTLDDQARKALELREEPDGPWPIQEDVANKLGVTARTLRKVCKWEAVLERAHELDRK